jgi:3-methyl-2-oxobutanoate hydroxymethyltransferase
MKKQTITKIQAAKGQKPLSMITAYDALFATLFEPHVDMILVGDSLNMSFLGEQDTLSATLEQMIYHTKAVCNGAPKAFVICDMPFGTYLDETSALINAVKVYQETKADSIKIEGGAEKASIVQHLVKHGIAVVGHVGLMPQSVRSEGSYKVKGKDEESAKKVLADAKAIEEAGACMIVVEGVKAEVAAQITKELTIPVIGIGAGVDVDGQVLVWSDMLGLFEAFTPKFVKQYLDGATLIKDAVTNYAKDVENRSFPSSEHTY